MDAGSSASFRRLLPSYHRPSLRDLTGNGPEPRLGFGAFDGDEPVAALLVERRPSGRTARALASGQSPAASGTPLAGLVRLAERTLESLGCWQLSFPGPPRADVEAALVDCGYARVPLVCGTGGLDLVDHAPGMQRARVPSGLEVVGWPELGAAEQHEVLERHRLEPGCPDQPAEPVSSLAVRHAGRLVAWQVNYRPERERVLIESIYVRLDLEPSGLGLAVTFESARRLHAGLPEVRWLSFEVYAGLERLLRALDRHVNPYLVQLRMRGGSVWARYLGPGRAALAAAERRGAPLPPRNGGERHMYWNRVHTRRSPHQLIELQRDHDGFLLRLDGYFQFHSADEYRYHEALVHPAMLVHGAPRRVLILGGGDGLAVREVLKHGGVERVRVVDIDPEVTELARRHPDVASLNAHSLDDRRVEVSNADAAAWIEEGDDTFDVILADFPDPNSPTLARLFTVELYRRLRARLDPGGALAVQSSSLFRTRSTFWCIVRSLEAAGFSVRPYQVASPSYGLWGFSLAAPRPFEVPRGIRVPTRFLDDDVLASLFALGRDHRESDVEPNTEETLLLAQYHRRRRPMSGDPPGPLSAGARG